MLTAAKIPARMTAAGFLDWCPEDGQVWQLVDGEPVAMAPASTTYARMQAEIGRLLGNHLLEHGGGLQCSNRAWCRAARREGA